MHWKQTGLFQNKINAKLAILMQCFLKMKIEKACDPFFGMILDYLPIYARGSEKGEKKNLEGQCLYSEYLCILIKNAYKYMVFVYFHLLYLRVSLSMSYNQTAEKYLNCCLKLIWIFIKSLLGTLLVYSKHVTY